MNDDKKGMGRNPVRNDVGRNGNLGKAVIPEGAIRTGIAAVVAGVLLAGCAAGGSGMGVQADQLRNSAHFVTETLISDMDFAGLQRNLFQHRAACGTAPRFVMKPNETGFATLIETAELPESYENVVIADLTQFPDSLRSPKRVMIRVYSYYYNDDVQQRVDRMLDAVRRPGVCPGT